MSVGDIAKKVGVAKSTVSIWCRNIILTEAQQVRIRERLIKAGHKGRMIGAEANRNKRIANIAKATAHAAEKVGQLVARDLLMLAIGLYWGEGSKGDDPKFYFTNSDPETILSMINILREIFFVADHELKPTLFINEYHRDRVGKVMRFWSNYLGLPVAQFGNPVLLRMRQRKSYPNRNSYYGVLRVGVRKSSLLKYEMLALIAQTKAKLLSRKNML